MRESRSESGGPGQNQGIQVKIRGSPGQNLGIKVRIRGSRSESGDQGQNQGIQVRIRGSRSQTEAGRRLVRIDWSVLLFKCRYFLLVQWALALEILKPVSVS
jgi:hypothetical protein